MGGSYLDYLGACGIQPLSRAMVAIQARFHAVSRKQEAGTLTCGINSATSPKYAERNE